MLQPVKEVGLAFQNVKASEGWVQLHPVLEYLCGPRQLPRQGMSTLSLVVIQTTDIHTELYCYMAIDPYMALNGSMGWVFALASGGPAGYTQQAISLLSCVSSYTSLHNASTVLLLFRSHMSTTYLHKLVALMALGPCGWWASGCLPPA